MQYDIYSYIYVYGTQADPSMSLPFKAKYKSVKDDIVADFGSLAFSLSDASLFTWTRIFIKLYQKAAAIDIERLIMCYTVGMVCLIQVNLN